MIEQFILIKQFTKHKTMAERPEDLNLPMSVVTRITKEALPDGCMVSKEARLALSKAARFDNPTTLSVYCMRS